MPPLSRAWCSITSYIQPLEIYAKITRGDLAPDLLAKYWVAEELFRTTTHGDFIRIRDALIHYSSGLHLLNGVQRKVPKSILETLRLRLLGILELIPLGLIIWLAELGRSTNRHI
tara:strand:- start:789 stop:1133 length:345 start_codon:yes stop_codon:yes gene_type:complete